MCSQYRTGLLCLAPLVFLFVSAVAGCGQPMKVSSYWGPGLRFSEATRSYDWAPEAQRTSGEGRPKNPRVHDLIREAVENHLGRKGYEKVSAGAPDFWIDYRVARDVRGSPYGGPHFTELTEGSLVLYAVNPEDSNLIWRGSIRAVLNDVDPPDVRMRTLDLAVKKMLDEVPSRRSAK